MTVLPTVALAADAVPSAGAEPPAAAEGGPELSPQAAAVVRPWGKDGKAVGENRVTGDTHRGDVLEVLQQLEDALDVEAGGPGGTILLADGVYVTAAERAVDLRSGVHLAAASPHGAVLKLADGTAARRKSGWFFRGRRVRNVVIDGILFDGNREVQTVRTRLRRDAAKGDTKIHVADASTFADHKREIGIRGGKKTWTTPGGFLIRDDRGGQERAKAAEVDADASVVRLLFPLRNDYTAEAGAEAVFYPTIGAVTLNGANIAVRNCKCIRTQESPVLFVSGGADQVGPKVLEDNVVLDHRGGACVRLQRGTRGGVIRGNTVVRPVTWYQRFWAEGVAIEGNAHSIVTGNTIIGPGDRLIRANDAHHCVIANNIVWVPLADVDGFEDAADWKPLRGDETVAPDSKDKRQGRASLHVAPATGTEDAQRPSGIRRADLADEARDWTPFNRAYLWIKPESKDGRLHLRLTDGDGRFADYAAVLWAADEWQTAIVDLTDPADASEDDLDKRDVRDIRVCLRPPDGERAGAFKVDGLRLGHRTGWGLTVWGASHCTVANNTFYGVGGKAGTIYYGSGGWSHSHDLAITGNSLAFCYDGIGWARQNEKRITVSDNVLYATMGGIRGDVVASGNTVAYDPTNAATDHTISARVADGNSLFRTRGIEVTGDEPAAATDNVLVDTRGPGIVSADNGGAVIRGNVLRSTLSPKDPAMLQRETATHNLIAGNWIEAAGAAFEIRGAHSTVSGNFVKASGERAVIVTGTDNVFRDNRGASRVRARVTLKSGAAPAARLRGVSSDEARRPVITAVDPVPKTTPEAPYAYDAYLQWDSEAKHWDVVVDWKRDPGADLAVLIRAD
jgi:hypothetical protein